MKCWETESKGVHWQKQDGRLQLCVAGKRQVGMCGAKPVLRPDVRTTSWNLQAKQACDIAGRNCQVEGC